MRYEMGVRRPGWPRLPESVREVFWEAVQSGLSPTAAGTRVGVHGATGRKWAREAGYQTWEGDLIVGANGASAIGTLAERTTGFVVLLHLPGDHTAATLADAITRQDP